LFNSLNIVCLYLFKVTDNELQAITQQPSEEGHHLIQHEVIGNQSDNLLLNSQSETLYVLDSSIQEREELIGPFEV